MLIESHSACIRRLGHHVDDVAASVRDFSMLDVVTTDRSAVLDASQMVSSAGLSIFDALIAEAVERSGCELLLTESDQLLEAELPFDVKNPFA